MCWRLLVIYVFAVNVVGSIIWIAEAGDRHSLQVLVDRGKTTDGTVVSFQAENHGAMEYVFKVAGKEYRTGSHANHSGTPVVGSRIPVAYDPQDPWDNCSCDPRRELANDAQNAIIGAMALGIAFPVLYWRFRRRLKL